MIFQSEHYEDLVIQTLMKPIAFFEHGLNEKGAFTYKGEEVFASNSKEEP